MRGTLLHNWLGDRILHKGLWSPTRESLARAWLVGWPVTIIPFMPGQSIIACIAALLVRGNLLLCIALQFLSTPLTAPVHLPACYFVGEVVRGANPRHVWREVRGKPRLLLTGHAVTSLYLGATVIGFLGGAIGYAVIHGTWRERPKRRGGHTTPPFGEPRGDSRHPHPKTDPGQLRLPLRERKDPPPKRKVS
jgi:uncharacterized protein (DUF2062 family)